jgi:flavin reductase
MASRFAAADWVEFASGNHALAGAIVSFDCYLNEARLMGTHNIMIGEVVGIRTRRDGDALLYFDRSFINIVSPAMTVPR